MNRQVLIGAMLACCGGVGGVTAQDAATRQDGVELMPLVESRYDSYAMVGRMGPEGSVQLIRNAEGAHQFVFANRAAAEAVRAARDDRGATLLEIYLSLGGAPADAPRDFVAEHGVVAPQRRARPIPGLRDRLEPSAGGGYFGDPAFCQTSGGLAGCGPLGDIRIGSIGQFNNICGPDEDLGDWEWYLNSHVANPFDGTPFPPGFDTLGASGVFGFGRSSGERNITIPATTSGGILVCDRPGSQTDWFTMVIEEELFPGAWFVLDDTGHFPHAAYGIAFSGTLSHHPIRIRIRYDSPPNPASEFFWAATY